MQQSHNPRRARDAYIARPPKPVENDTQQSTVEEDSHAMSKKTKQLTIFQFARETNCPAPNTLGRRLGRLDQRPQYMGAVENDSHSTISCRKRQTPSVETDSPPVGHELKQTNFFIL